MKASPQKPQPPKAGSLAAWLDRAMHDAIADAALEFAAAAIAQPGAEATLAATEPELLATLQLLESLDLDRETLAAYVLHALRQAGVVLDPKRLAKLPSGLRDLLDGQQAADKVGVLYA